MANKAMVDLVKEEEHTHQCARWTREEEIFLCQCWVKTFESGEIEDDRSGDSFWGQIMQDFNTSTVHGFRTRNMLTGKWTRVNSDCQKFNAIYKHLERKRGGNEADRIKTAKINFFAQQPKGRKFMLEHAWRILKKHSKWVEPKPLDTEDHIEIFRPDVKPHSVSEDLRRKLQAGTSTYEAKKQKELEITEFKELEFLTVDPDRLPEPKASIIERNKKNNCKL
ncbi:hypothetical protein Tco_1547335 [Tanacetum coccineum]